MNEQENSTSSSSNDALTSVSSKQGNKSLVRVSAVVVVILALVAAAWMSGMFDAKDAGIPAVPAEGDAAAKLTPEQAAMVIATVNGAGITRGEFEETLTNVKTSLSPEAIAALEPNALEESVMRDMVNMRLLLNAAEKKKITVTDADVQKEYTMFEESIGGNEKLLAELQNVGLDEAKFRENIKSELMVRRLLDQETDIEKITVTDAEISKIYDEAKTVAPEDQPMPPLEEVKDVAREQLLQQKSAEIINAYIETLRKDAQIEIKP